MANFCMLCDDLSQSLTQSLKAGLRTLVPLEKLPAACDIVNTYCPVHNSAASISCSLPTLPGSCVVLSSLLPVIAVFKPKKGNVTGINLVLLPVGCLT